MRVMSVSIKTIAPNQVIKNRNIFKNVLEKDMSSLHIYAISYFLCDDYQIELKPSKYHGIHRTLFLREFGGQSPDKTMVPFETEKQMIAQFQADLRRYDPDVLVCHDASRTLDALVQRMVTLGGKQDRPKLGRLVHYY
jgi:DNA polymerase elongation subunit (family B)